jgi:hypothetical protein
MLGEHVHSGWFIDTQHTVGSVPASAQSIVTVQGTFAE